MDTRPGRLTGTITALPAGTSLEPAQNNGMCARKRPMGRQEWYGHFVRCAPPLQLKLGNSGRFGTTDLDLTKVCFLG